MQARASTAVGKWHEMALVALEELRIESPASLVLHLPAMLFIRARAPASSSSSSTSSYRYLFLHKGAVSHRSSGFH